MYDTLVGDPIRLSRTPPQPTLQQGLVPPEQSPDGQQLDRIIAIPSLVRISSHDHHLLSCAIDADVDLNPAYAAVLSLKDYLSPILGVF